MGNEIQFLLYAMPDEEGKVQVVVKDETLWCTQKAMAQLFGVGVPAVSKHLKNIFDEGELNKEVVVSKMEITTQHGAMADKSQTHNVDFYHLDAIIAVGYRVNSARATKFRQWATKILSEYIKKGFAMDDERLKQGTAVFGKDYFREFLTFRRYQILPDKGKISAAEAKEKAEAEYDIFNRTQRIDSDFDKEVRVLLEGE